MNTPHRDASPAPLLVPPPTAVRGISKDGANEEKSAVDARKPAVQRPTFSSSSAVSISHESNAQIILPSSPSNASKPCSLTSLKSCVFGASLPSPQGSSPFSGLTIKNINRSLLVCGPVSGPAHITAVEDSTIAVTCRQFRMHECKNVDVYLSCSSRPIIEDCDGIHFAPLPNIYVSCTTPECYDSIFVLTSEKIQRFPSLPPTNPLSEATDSSCTTTHESSTLSISSPPPTTAAITTKPTPQQPPDLWSQIDDFNWLKPTPSPHWTLIPSEDLITENAWRKVVPGGPEWSLEDILKSVRVAEK